MSKFFIEKSDVFRVNLDDDQWVDIKKELNQADNDLIMSKMVTTKSEVNKKDPRKPKTVVSIELGKLPLMECSIVAWSFTNDDGSPAPINAENISNLRGQYRTKVLSEINRLTKESRGFLAG